jgi:hypothetical protein
LASLLDVGLFGLSGKFTIEQLFPNKPADSLLKLLIFLQQWKPLVKACDEDVTKLLISRFQTTAITLSQRERAPVM